MSTLLASFVVILLAVAAMSLGVLFGRRPIRGSCGGIAGGGCGACTGRCERRTGEHQHTTANREKDAC